MKGGSAILRPHTELGAAPGRCRGPTLVLGTVPAVGSQASAPLDSRGAPRSLQEGACHSCVSSGSLCVCFNRDLEVLFWSWGENLPNLIALQRLKRFVALLVRSVISCVASLRRSFGSRGRGTQEVAGEAQDFGVSQFWASRGGAWDALSSLLLPAATGPLLGKAPASGVGGRSATSALGFRRTCALFHVFSKRLACGRGWRELFEDPRMTRASNLL